MKVLPKAVVEPELELELDGEDPNRVETEVDNTVLAEFVVEGAVVTTEVPKGVDIIVPVLDTGLLPLVNMEVPKLVATLVTEVPPEDVAEVDVENKLDAVAPHIPQYTGQYACAVFGS